MRQTFRKPIELRRHAAITFPDVCADCGRRTRHSVKVPIRLTDKLQWGIVHLVAAFVPLVGLFALGASPGGKKERVPVCWRCRRGTILARVSSVLLFVSALACFMFLPGGETMELTVGIFGVILLCAASGLSAAAALVPLPVTITELPNEVIYRFRSGAYRDWLEEHQQGPQQNTAHIFQKPRAVPENGGR